MKIQSASSREPDAHTPPLNGTHRITEVCETAKESRVINDFTYFLSPILSANSTRSLLRWARSQELEWEADIVTGGGAHARS